jgi:hypothetical protein
VEAQKLHHDRRSLAALREILHDPVSYPDPDAFKPERFLMNGQLNPDVQDPALSAFGFGQVRTPLIQQTYHTDIIERGSARVDGSVWSHCLSLQHPYF